MKATNRCQAEQKHQRFVNIFVTNFVNLGPHVWVYDSNVKTRGGDTSKCGVVKNNNCSSSLFFYLGDQKHQLQQQES
jgi:hypothetical protein